MTPTKNRAHDETVALERAGLGCVLESPDLMGEVQTDLADSFLLEDHRRLWRAGVKLHGEGIAPDVALLAAEAGVDLVYVAGLLDSGYLLKNFPVYLQRIQSAARERKFSRLYEELGTAAADDRPRILEQLTTLGSEPSATADWRELFHSWQDFESAPKLQFAIEGFLQEGGTTFITGLPGHSKTLVMLAMARALLEREPLFGYFSVHQPSKRVLYLVPECTIAPFWARIRLFHLEEYARSDRLLVRTLSSKQDVELTDPRILAAVKGADVFLDTAVRFMAGAENDVENARLFAGTLFNLLSAGARTITGAHHAPKSFGQQDFMTLENVLRGSGDLGASICTAWGLRQIDSERNRIFCQNVKPRDFQPCEPFIIEGRPHLDLTGHFQMTEPPGFAGEMQSHLGKRGAPSLPNKSELQRQAVEMKAHGKSLREIAKELNIGRSTVGRMVSDPTVPEVSQLGTVLGHCEEHGTGRTL